MDKYGYVIKNNICLFQKGPLSQWWGAYKGQESSFTIENNRGVRTTFNCCEQYMMAAKADFFGDDDIYEKIMNTSKPNEQKDLGRQVKDFDDAFWAKARYGIILDGNKYKFEQNEEAREYLLSFNRHTIFAEAAPWDKVYGIGLGPENPDSLDINKWKGLNLLGEVIRETRRWLENPDRNRGSHVYYHPDKYKE